MVFNRALLSVSDKQGIIDFAKELSRLNIEIISTGGTARVLQQEGIPVILVSDLTGFPEILDGRVKTLHPHIHAGILAQRDNQHHMDTLEKHHIGTIDIVACNLYPFEATIQKPHASMEEIIENIDIGGPTLLRAAAKNYKDVIVLTHPSRYADIIAHLKSNTTLDIKYREKLAVAAFLHTAQYDAIISTYLHTHLYNELLPDTLSIPLRKLQNMRYGENPHQQGAFYKTLPPTTEPCITNAEQLQGKELSFNNILDGDCAIEAIKEFNDPACVIIKHATPCGIACADTLLTAWKDAYSTDVYSPYGGIVSFNREVGVDVATELSQYFLEVVIAPKFTPEALNVFSTKKNLRLLNINNLDKKNPRRGITFRSVVGGVLIEERDTKEFNSKNWKIVTKKKPTKSELKTMLFAIQCVKHVKSNSVLFAKDTRTVAIGGGQTSRVDATWIATHKGKKHIKGSIMASDAFFPFRDAVDVAAQAGVQAIVHPGGSIHDTEVIQAADEHKIAMVFTGQRYFRH
jgi:phosphoribosylaminoimidazolecarboxamide formyltransferase/IMP cyclohydrolase